ncbi:MAG: hypothetical protein RIC18_00890 [Hoeflea sp.]|uniref:hypothetical protein n=1 Tax=Hoeflea sp. TaxID=1940281 RepID=UPI0032ED4D72
MSGYFCCFAQGERNIQVRAFLLACALIFGVAAGASTAVPGTAVAASRKAGNEITQVYFIRGFMGVFSTGFDKMAEELGKSGIDAKVYSHLSGGAISARIAREFGQSGNRRKKLVLIGHSFGGNAALAVASRLRAKNITVDLVITVDPTRSGPVSSNVRRYVNYYFSGNGLGSKLASGNVSARRIRNVDMRKRVDIAGEGDDHWTVTHNAAIRKEITDAIRRTVR